MPFLYNALNNHLICKSYLCNYMYNIIHFLCMCMDSAEKLQSSRKYWLLDIIWLINHNLLRLTVLDFLLQKKESSAISWSHKVGCTEGIFWDAQVQLQLSLETSCWFHILLFFTLAGLFCYFYFASGFRPKACLESSEDDQDAPLIFQILQTLPPGLAQGAVLLPPTPCLLSDNLRVSSCFRFLCGQSYLCKWSDPFASSPRTAISTSSSPGQRPGGGLHYTSVWKMELL